MRKKTIGVAIAFLALLLLTGRNVFAQENNLSQTQMYVIADVDISDVAVAQQGNKLDISFVLSNGEKTQAGIKYGMKLVKVKKEDNGNESFSGPVDFVVYNDVISLDYGDKIKKEIQYKAPDWLNGEYKIILESENEKGLPLAFHPVEGRVIFHGNGDYVEIKQDSCYLIVDGKKYTYDFGIDIAKDEKVDLLCDVINHSNKELSIKPVVTTYQRSIYGKQVSEKDISNNLTLKPEEKGVMKFVLPIENKPQSFNAIVSLNNASTNKNVSNKISVRYVIQGVSGTVSNIRLNSDYYKKDDVAKVSFLIAMDADSFSYARNKNKNIDRNRKAVVTISNSDNEKCGAGEINVNDTKEYEANIKIKKECLNPNVDIKLYNSQGKLLDSFLVKIKSKNIQHKIDTGVNNNINKKNTSKSVLYMMIIFGIVLIGFAYLFLRKKRFFGVFIFIVTGFLLLSVNNVLAYTVLIQPQGADLFTVTYSLNKTQYNPGDKVKLNIGSPTLAVCSNRAIAAWAMGRLAYVGAKKVWPEYEWDYRGGYYDTNGGSYSRVVGTDLYNIGQKEKSSRITVWGGDTHSHCNLADDGSYHSPRWNVPNMTAGKLFPSGIQWSVGDLSHENTSDSYWQTGSSLSGGSLFLGNVDMNCKAQKVFPRFAVIDRDNCHNASFHYDKHGFEMPVNCKKPPVNLSLQANDACLNGPVNIVGQATPSSSNVKIVAHRIVKGTECFQNPDILNYAQTSPLSEHNWNMTSNNGEKFTLNDQSYGITGQLGTQTVSYTAWGYNLDTNKYINTDCKTTTFKVNSCSCTGSIPAGGQECPGDATGLTSSIPWQQVSKCTDARKCEYTKVTVDLKGSYGGVNNSDGPLYVIPNDSFALNWTVSNATSCTASSSDGGWSGSKSATGGYDNNVTTSVGGDYTLNCSGAGGSSSDTVQVNLCLAQTYSCVGSSSVDCNILPDNCGKENTVSNSCNVTYNCNGNTVVRSEVASVCRDNGVDCADTITQYCPACEAKSTWIEVKP